MRIKGLPHPEDHRLVADVIRAREEDRRAWLLVLAIFLLWRERWRDATAIVTQGWPA